MLDTQQSNPVKLLFRDREDFRAIHDGEGQSFVAVALLYAAILTCLAVGWLANNHLSLIAAAPIYLACIAVIGWAQYSIGNGMHEAVHHNFGNKKSDRWASIVTAYPIGLTMSYRSVHLEHHHHLGTSNDPELGLYTVFPKSRAAMLLRFVWFASGIPAILQFFQQQSSGAESRRGLLVAFAVQVAIVLAFYLAFGNVLFYIFFWSLPIATVGKLLSSTRLLCEHGSPATNGWFAPSPGRDGRRGSWALSTLIFTQSTTCSRAFHMLASPNFTFATKVMRSLIPNIDRSMGASNSSKAVISGFCTSGSVICPGRRDYADVQPSTSRNH